MATVAQGSAPQQRFEAAPTDSERQRQNERIGRYAALRFHAEQAIRRRDQVIGVDATDPECAVFACVKCSGRHCIALLERPRPRQIPPPFASMPTRAGEI